MKSIMLSIKPSFCELIARGKKTIEIRKTKPKIDKPIKCYIYCTKDKPLCVASGKVIGEFVCNNISIYPYFDNGYSVSYGYVTITNEMIQKMCLDLSEIEDYGSCKKLYGWYISDLIIYDNPKELSDLGMKRPPQSWCYVKERGKDA